MTFKYKINQLAKGLYRSTLPEDPYIAWMKELGLDRSWMVSVDRVWDETKALQKRIEKYLEYYPDFKIEDMERLAIAYIKEDEDWPSCEEGIVDHIVDYRMLDRRTLWLVVCYDRVEHELIIHLEPKELMNGSHPSLCIRHCDSWQEDCLDCYDAKVFRMKRDKFTDAT